MLIKRYLTITNSNCYSSLSVNQAVLRTIGYSLKTENILCNEQRTDVTDIQKTVLARITIRKNEKNRIVTSDVPLIHFTY